MAGWDDEIWEAVPEDPGPPPAHIAEFVAGLAPADRALDLGCGDGRVSQLVAAGQLTVADVSQVALDRARRRLADAEVVRIEPDQPLPFADAQFDLVLATETIEHVRDTQLFLSEARRVLAPAGRLVLTTPSGSRWRLLVRGPEHPFSPHLRTFTRGMLREVLEAMGFEIERLTTRRGTLLALASR